MAKLSMPTNTQNDPEVDVIAEDITSALAQLAWLLEGRIDYDNIAKIVDGKEERALQIPASKVQDIPLISNEINCNKFFRDETGTYKQTGVSNNFLDLVWNPLKNKVVNTPAFTVIESDLSIKITKETRIYERSVDYGEFAGEITTETREGSGTDWGRYTRNKSLYRKKERIIAEIPETHLPVKNKRITNLFEDIDFADSDFYYDKRYCAVFTYTTDSSIGDSATKFFMEVSPISYDIELNAIISDIKIVFMNQFDDLFGDSDFININIKLSVLCEERI